MKLIKSVILSVCFALSSQAMAGEVAVKGVTLIEVKTNAYNNCFLSYYEYGKYQQAKWKCPSTNGDTMLGLATAAYLSGLKVDLTYETTLGVKKDLLAVALHQK